MMALVHFHGLVGDIAFHPGLGLKLQQLMGMHRAVYRTVDDDVVGTHLPLAHGPFH